MKLCRVLNYWATRPNNESRLFSLPSVPALVYNDAMISGNVASVMREDAGKETAETDQVVVAVSDVCFSYGDAADLWESRRPEATRRRGETAVFQGF